MNTLSDTKLHELARKRVDFRTHLIVYCVINAVLWTIWFITGQGYMWPIWPLAGWGIGLFFHYMFDYRSTSFLSEDEEFIKLKREMEERGRINQ